MLTGAREDGTYVTEVYINNTPVTSLRERSEATVQLRAWPNLVSVGARVTVAYTAQVAGVVQVTVTGIDGRVVSQSAAEVSFGAQTIDVGFADVAAGVYDVAVGENRLRVVVE